MYDESINGSIEHIETFLKAFSLEESEIGIVLTPAYDEDEETAVMEYFVEGYDEKHKPTLDSVIHPENVSDTESGLEYYRRWMEAIENRFPEAEILAAEPEEMAPRPRR